MSTYGTVEPTMPSQARRDSGLVASRGALGAVARFWQRTFAPDYIGLVLLIIGYFMVRSVYVQCVQSLTTASTDIYYIDCDICRAFSSHVHA
jgi:hypothetical protein